jgi:hypothetical protein
MWFVDTLNQWFCCTLANLFGLLTVMLSVYQKGTYYTGISVFNGLPSQIKELCHNRNQFKRDLKCFLHVHSCYTLDEYFSCNKI